MNPALRYLAPEVAESPPWLVGPWSDLYGLGLIVWELLTGEKPFTGQSELETMQRIVRGQRAEIQACRPDLPAELAV